MKRVSTTTLGLLSALLLGACSADVGTDATPDETAHAQHAISESQLTFGEYFGEVAPAPELVAGGTVHVTYAPSRFYKIIDSESSVGWFASAYHCYGYGCCQVTFPDVTAHYRFDDGEFASQPLDDDNGFTLPIPSQASKLELYFETPGFDLRTWYCGCGEACSQENYENSGASFRSHQSYDSRYGENYVFDVTPGENTVESTVQRTADGQWSTNPNEELTSWDSNVWIDVAVQNLSYHKTVGVRWTVDDWQTSQDSYAEYEQSIGGGYEQWGVDIAEAARTQSCEGCSPTVFEYGVFYTHDGTTTWDNNDGENYQLELATSYE